MEENITSWEELLEKSKGGIINQTKEKSDPVTHTIHIYEEGLDIGWSYYKNLSDENKRLFKQSIENENDVDRETMASFLRSGYKTRYIMYKQ